MDDVAKHTLRSGRSRLLPMFGTYNRRRFLRRLNTPETPGSGPHMRKSENLLRIIELVAQINGMDIAQAAKAPPVANRYTMGEQEVTTFAETRVEEIEDELNGRAHAAQLSIFSDRNSVSKKENCDAGCCQRRR